MAAADSQALTALLEKTRWGKEFAWPELMQLSGYLRLDRHRTGTVVCREGEQDASLLIIGKGSVKVLKEDGSNTPKFVTQLGEGQVVGEIALLDGQPRSAMIVTIDEVLMLVLTKEMFVKLCDENPRLGVKVALRLARFLSARLRATTGALAAQL